MSEFNSKETNPVKEGNSKELKKQKSNDGLDQFVVKKKNTEGKNIFMLKKDVPDDLKDFAQLFANYKNLQGAYTKACLENKQKSLDIEELKSNIPEKEVSISSEDQDKLTYILDNQGSEAYALAYHKLMKSKENSKDDLDNSSLSNLKNTKGGSRLNSIVDLWNENNPENRVDSGKVKDVIPASFIEKLENEKDKDVLVDTYNKLESVLKDVMEEKVDIFSGDKTPTHIDVEGHDVVNDGLSTSDDGGFSEETKKFVESRNPLGVC